jgi:hypothetical protein
MLLAMECWKQDGFMISIFGCFDKDKNWQLWRQCDQGGRINRALGIPCDFKNWQMH